MTSAINDPDEAAFAQEHPRAYAAIGYALRGWRVLPVHWITEHGRCTCLAGGQAACASAGKHPLDPGWPDEATTDVDEIILIWGQSPEANIGIATGSASGFFVVDVDEGVRPDGTYKQGLESLIDLQTAYDELPETYTVTTGGGGSQYYFVQPVGYTIKSLSRAANREPALGVDYPDIDVKGDGGMVVAPPSVSGRGPYVTETDADVAEPPQWLVDLLLRRGIMEPVEGPEDPAPGTSTAAPSPAVVAQTPPPGWFEAGMRNKLHEVQAAPPGMANMINNRIAYMVGQYVPHGWITQEEAETRLIEAASQRRTPNAEAEFTIRRAVRQGMAHPYQDLAQAAQNNNTTDKHMAQRVASELLRGRYCHVQEIGWLEWDGHVWRITPEDQLVRVISDYLLDQARAYLPHVVNNATARKSIFSLTSASRINAIMRLARSEVIARPDWFDADPDVLNTPSGVVDLRTGELTEANPFRYMMKITNVPYVKGASHADWDAALEALPEDVRGWFQVRMGQAITGHTPPDDSMILMQGTGANGKTTIVNTIAKVIGSYYAMVPSGVLTARQEDPHAMMPFKGARIAVVEELPEGRRLNVIRVKEIVGTPTMTGRYMFKNLITWDASHSLIITTNYVPVVSETDSGTWRRLRMLKFPFRFVRPHKPLETARDRHGDPQLRYRLATRQAQREAVLAWMVDGARTWYAHDRQMPEDPYRVEADTEAWRDEADLIRSVVWGKLLIKEQGFHVMKTDLFHAFNRVIESTGHNEWNDQTFNDRFRDHEETLRNKIEEGRPTTTAGLSRPAPLQPEDAPIKHRSWIGVRFRTEDDE